jgi:hypothetical protein
MAIGKPTNLCAIFICRENCSTGEYFSTTWAKANYDINRPFIELNWYEQECCARLARVWTLTDSQLEKKKHDHEKLKEQRRLLEAEMRRLDEQSKYEEEGIKRMSQGIDSVMASGGPIALSEPNTPPEQRNVFVQSTTFPSFPRSRLSGSSIITPPGMLSRPSASLLTTPTTSQSGSANVGPTNPSRSVPNTRRNSDDAEIPTEPLPELHTRIG